MHDFEIGKLLVIPEFDVSNAADSFSDRFIECDDSTMDRGVSDREQVNDIFPVAGKLLQPVGESEEYRSNCSVPSNGPVSAIFDCLGGLDSSERDLDLSELLDLGVVVGSGELSTEDSLEVDSSPCDNVLPLRVWKFGTVWFVNERSSRCFEVNYIHSDEFESFDESVSQHGMFISFV